MTLGSWTPPKTLAFRQAFVEFLQYVKINSKETGGGTILGDHVYAAQQRFLDCIFDGLANDIHNFKILKSRQLGMSTMSRALSVFWLGMHSGLQGAMVFDTYAHRDEARTEIMEIIRELPDKFGFPKITKDSRDMLRLSNGSILRFLNAGVRKSRAAGTLGRSSGINFVHASEMCSWDNDEGLVSFLNALTENYPDRLYLWESTARGFNQWFKMWEEAKADTLNQRTCFIGWWAKELQVIPQGTAAFKRYGETPPSDAEKKRIQEVLQRYGHQITAEQLAWYRRKSNPLMGANTEASEEAGVDELMQQEQPWCVTRDTRVGTDIGILRIENIRADMTATRGRVSHAGVTGRSPIWRATTKLGYRVRGTPNHPLITTAGKEVRLDKSLGCKIKLQPPRTADVTHTVRWREGCSEVKVDITADFARFVGFFMGDGSAYRQGNGLAQNSWNIKITCDAKDLDVVEECKRLFRSCFGKEPYVKKQTSACMDVGLNTRVDVEMLGKLGLTRNDTGSTKRKICVPEFIWCSPKNIIKEFLSGLFEADGFNGFWQHRVAFFSKNADFLRDIQLLLLIFGVTSRGIYGVKKQNKTHTYTGNQLELRAEESRLFNKAIGFISDRKRSRYLNYEGRKNQRGWASSVPIVLEDEIVSVVDEGVIENVFNLSVEGEHLFDANGILTHNTENEAFLQSGSSFFPGEKLTEITKSSATDKYKGYDFITGSDFFHCDFHPVIYTKRVQLKVWEDPEEGGNYVISADPAFGHDEKNNHSAIQVLRCYADCMVQVAEYANSVITTQPFAWVIASLAGWYKNSTVILEINGPGEAVLNELKSLRTILSRGHMKHVAQEKGLRDIFTNVRDYIYSRSDSTNAGHVSHWKTTTQLKVAIMERLRDFLMDGTLVLRSFETLDEMKAVVRNGDSIGAEGRNRDDRTYCLAMASRAWDQSIRRSLSLAGRTKAHEDAIRRLTIKDQIGMFNKHALDSFFKSRKTEKSREMAILRRKAWRG